MTALVLTLFVSLGLAFLAILLFAHGVVQGDHDHADRLSLLPLDEDTGRSEPAPAGKDAA